MRLFGLNNIFAFVSLLPRKMQWMLEEAKHSIAIRPVVIAMTVIAFQDSGSGGSDLLRGFEPTVGDPPLQRLELLQHTGFRLIPLGPLVGEPFFGTNDKHSNAGCIGGNFLNQRLRDR